MELMAATVPCPVSRDADREDAPAAGLASDDFTQRADPWSLFRDWMEAAGRAEPNDPNAMALATVGTDGLPNVRIMLLKAFDERGLVFFTNDRSAKGEELSENAQAAVVLHWKSLRRQVRARGSVTRVSPEESDTYFASRPRESRIGAVASRQSHPLADRATLMREAAAIAARHEDGPVPRPAHWSGYRIAPVSIEFWQDGACRLHDRVHFKRADVGWTRVRLYP